MQMFVYAIIFLSFFFSILSMLAGVWAITMALNLKQDWLEKVAEVEIAVGEVGVIKTEMQTALELVHKLHLDRQEDLKPLFDKLAVLEVRANAIAANQRMK